MELPALTSMSGTYSMAEGSEAISEADEINRVHQLFESADEAFQAEDYTEALQLYTEALEMDEGNADIISSRAATYMQLGNYVLAQKDAEKILVHDPNNSQGYYLQGVAFDNLGQYRESMLAFLKALHIDTENAATLTTNIASLASHFCVIPEGLLQTIPDMDPYKKLCEVGACLYQADKHDLCVKVLTAAQNFQTNQQGITMKLLLTLANAYAALKNRDTAISVYQDCLTTAVASHDDQYQTKALVNVASLFLEAGDTHRAIVYYEKLIDLEKNLLLEQGELPDYWNAELLSALHLNLSIAYKSIGNIELALVHGKEYAALVKESQLKSHAEAQAYHNIGMLYEMLGDYSVALEQYKKFLEQSKQKGDKKGVALAYGCLGSVYGNLKNKQLALTYHEQHVNMANTLQVVDQKVYTASLEQMGDTLVNFKDYDAAAECYTKMFQACQRNDVKGQVTALCKLGNTFQEQERFQYSLYYYEQAKVIAEDFEFEDIIILCRQNLACILQYSTQMFELDQAKAYFEQLIPIFEAKLQEHKDEGTFCPKELSVKLNQCYRGVQNVLAKLGKKEECLLFAETQRAKYATNIHNNTQKSISMAGIDPVTAATLSRWTMDKVNHVVSQQKGTILVYTISPRSLFTWVLQPGLGVVRFYTRPASKDKSVNDDIQECLNLIKARKKQTNLMYGCENRALPLRGIELQNLQKSYQALSGDSEDKKQYFRELERSISEGDKEEPIKKKSPERRLFDMLIAPVDDILSKLDTGSPLLIVPDQILYELPFGILTDWSNKCLEDRFHISYIPSLFVLDKALQNELNQLKIKDEIEYDRTQSRMGSLSKIITKVPKDLTSFPHGTPVTFLSSMDLDSIDPKRTSNPRLLKSGVLHSRQTAVGEMSRATTGKTGPESSARIPSGISLKSFIGPSVPPEKVAGAHTLSTLTTRTSTGTDITTSNYTVTQFCQISDPDKCVVIGSPALPNRLFLHDKPWSPPSKLFSAQEECLHVGTYLDVGAVTGEAATKQCFLKELSTATVLHIATYGCLNEGYLVLAPNPERSEEDLPVEQSYIVTLEEIVSTKMVAKLVVLSTGWSAYDRNYVDEGFRLPGAFITAGAQCVVTLLWPVPDVVLEKFYFTFYKTLQKGQHVTQAVTDATAAIKQDDRFSEVTYWSPFVVIGKDVHIHLGSIRHSMLDQTIDKTEEEYTAEKNNNPLSPPPRTPVLEDLVVLLEKVQQCVSQLLAHHGNHPDVLTQLISLLDGALKRLHVRNLNQHTVKLPSCIEGSTSGIQLLKLLGFHFQADGAYITDPYTILPHWNPDQLMLPCYEALCAMQEIILHPETAQAIQELLPIEQDTISHLVDVMCITKNASDLQLKTSDTSVKPLWHITKVQKFLTSLGYHQIGLLLNFSHVTPNRKLLAACLQLFISLSCHKSVALLHKLDVSLLGVPGQMSQPAGSPADAVKLPSLTPLILPRNQVRMSTPWFSTAEVPDEMDEKMKLARSASDLNSEYRKHLTRAKTWHELSVKPQAEKALNRVGRAIRTPNKVKVMSGSSASNSRIPVDLSPVLTLNDIDQRRDYAKYILHQRLDGVAVRHKNELKKVYLPYIENA